jgi:hypothetical protein
LVLAASLLVASLAGAHETGAQAGNLVLSAHDMVRYLHIVLLVFWLGPDVAIMVAASHVINTGLNAAQRVGAATMMHYYEIMPRVCMSVMLTVGGVLSEHVGLTHPWWQMAAIWLLGPVWLALTLAAYFGSSEGAGALASRLETWLRIAVIFGVPLSVTFSISTGRLAQAPYVGGKLLLFAVVLALGLLARRAFGPFSDGVKKLAREGSSPAVDQAITVSFARGRRFVLASWVALLLAALSGVVQPGAPDDASPVAENHAAP